MLISALCPGDLTHSSPVGDYVVINISIEPSEPEGNAFVLWTSTSRLYINDGDLLD